MLLRIGANTSWSVCTEKLFKCISEIEVKKMSEYEVENDKMLECNLS